MERTETPVLYITYDGLTDPLGQAQILPYLTGINRKYNSVTILSAEKKQNYSKNKQAVIELLSQTTIRWKHIKYHRNPPVFSTLLDLIAMRRTAANICRKQTCIVHCRSYIAALIGLHLKMKYGAKLVFDMRGFWADERLDGGIWTLNNPIYKRIYHYFKRKEKEFFEQSDAIISLTHAGKKEIQKLYGTGLSKITVIPCCVDRKLFDPSKFSNNQVAELRKRLGFQNDDFIITYLGSVGTWYLLDEMLSFFKHLKQIIPASKLLVVTNDTPLSILKSASYAGIDNADIVVVNASRKEVPLYLKSSDTGLFFIKKVYSKIASSPTKMGEFLSMGIPVIGNNGVGDVEHIINECECGITLPSFDKKSFNESAKQTARLNEIPKEVMISAADKYFDLEKGIENYLEVYDDILHQS